MSYGFVGEDEAGKDAEAGNPSGFPMEADTASRRRNQKTCGISSLSCSSPRVRQAHMRHTDPRLTDVTYMDESLLPVADELYSMPWIPAPGEEKPEAILLRKTGTDQGL